MATLLAFGSVLALQGTAHAQLDRAEKVRNAYQIAVRQIGDPYRYGASGPNAFDCSGLTSFAYRRAGLSIPRTSSAQARATRRIARAQLRLGDLMFFAGGSGVYHVGLFAGRRDGRVRILHSPSTGGRVRIERVWTSGWFAGRLR